MNKKMKSYKTLLSLLLLLSCSGSALAEQMKSLEENWYIGGSLGLGILQPQTHAGAQVIDDKDLAVKVYAGVNITNQIGLEAFWSKLGESEISGATGNGKVKYSTLGVNGIYHFPIYSGRIHPFGKLGIAKINTRTTGFIVEKKDNDFSLFGGIGAEYDLSKGMKVRAEYEYFTKDISQLSLGINWSPNERMHYMDIRHKSIPAALPMNYSFPQGSAKAVKKTSRSRIQKRNDPRLGMKNTSFSSNSLFSTGSSHLSRNGVFELNKLVNKVRNQSFQLHHITISGHTDNIGTRTHNLKLSKKRAEAVANYMASKGVPRHQMSVVGLGEAHPVSTNTTSYGRSLNRRVDIKIKGVERNVVSN